MMKMKGSREPIEILKKGGVKMGKRVKLLVVALVATSLLVISVAGVALAQEPADTDDMPAYCGLGWDHSHGQEAICSKTVSELSGLTPEEIQAQRQEGKSLVEIAAAQGVSEDALVEAIMEVKKETVQQKVEAATLTQEQADLMLEQMEQRTIQAVNRTTSGPPDWGGGNGYGQGTCDGQGQGTGPGGMHRWGMGSR